MIGLFSALFLACVSAPTDKSNDTAEATDSGSPTALEDSDGDGYTTEEDCDDTNVLINPVASERCNGLDDNCDGIIDEGFDSDGDGFLVTQFCPDGDDCDDEDPLSYPGADEVPYDGRDQDCDGADLTDVDADGYASEAAGGEDCDDNDPAISPGITDIPKDGIDQDCDGADSIDGDGDGYDDEALGGDDCDDTDPSINPGAVDWLNDGINSDCTGISDPFLSLASVNASIVGVTTNQEALLGQSIALCDLDEDRLDDLIITAPFADAYSGTAGIFYGAGWSTWADNMLMESADARITGEANGFLGMEVACTDLDSDGHQDLLVVSGEVEYAAFPLSK
ncbi:MAG: putative metal-binding motif-containing protein, partial [Myxococcota bacterium]|nr:putative metal-binding motif-containing protein [Myxococcota bacterium]